MSTADRLLSDLRRAVLALGALPTEALVLLPPAVGSLTLAAGELDGHLSLGRDYPGAWKRARLDGIDEAAVTPEVVAHFMGLWGPRVLALHNQKLRHRLTRATCACGATAGGPATPLCREYGDLQRWAKVAALGASEDRDGWLRRARLFLASLVAAEEASATEGREGP